MNDTTERPSPGSLPVGTALRDRTIEPARPNTTAGPEHGTAVPTAIAGLTEAEARSRRRGGEGNDVRARQGRSYLAIVWESAASPVNAVLFAVSAALIVLDLPIDAAMTALPVLANIVVSAALEASAKWRLDRLRILSAPRATVIRDGRERSIDPAELVRDDVVVIGRGDQVVLDGELLDGGVEVDESLLTGESDPVARRPGDPLLSGSVCVSGRGVMRVTRVGLESYANQLTAQAQSAGARRTPLQHDIDRLIATTAVLVAFVSVVVAFAFAEAGTTGTGLVQAAAVLVALVPQGLAIMVTLTYATGALRISRAGALVQRINAVESMSRVNTIVLDKTGTITAPRFELREFQPVGVDASTARALLGTIAETMPAGDRIGDALGRWLAGATGGTGEDAKPGSDAPSTGRDTPATAPATRDVAGTNAESTGRDGVASSATVDRVAFSSARRWSGIVEAGAGGAVIIGAPEVLLRPDGDPALAATVEQWTDAGQRVLVLARADATTLHGTDGAPLVPEALAPVALIAFGEQIRPDAGEILREFEASGVALKVVSGDDPRTVAHIAREAGVAGADQPPVHAAELASLDEAALGARVDRTSVVGRVEPAMKARIVRALRSRGRYVAMVGDGVNDILALKSADLGVAMESGSSASRAVADIVLLDDRFSVLPKAVAEGRRIIDGMLGSASLLLTRTLYMLCIVFGAAVADLAFPFTPRNNSLLALVTVGLPSLVLVAWARPVTPPRSLVRTVLGFSVPAALGVTAVALPVYGYYLAHGATVDIARSALITITAYCGILLIPFFSPPCRAFAPWGDPERGYDWRPTLLAAAMAVLYGVLLSLPLARWFFQIEPIPLADAAILGGIALAWAVVLAVLRALVSWIGRREQPRPAPDGGRNAATNGTADRT